MLQDYFLLEMELASTYAPQNVYCYSVDKKASPRFRRQIRDLADCLPNVFYDTNEFIMDSGGHNQNAAHLSCLSILQQYPWKYAILLQVSC